MNSLALTKHPDGYWRMVFSYRTNGRNDEKITEALQWFEQHGVAFQSFLITRTHYHLSDQIDANTVLAIRLRWTGVLNLQWSD